MKNLKISRKLFVIFTAILAFVFLTTGISLGNLIYSANQFQNFYEHSYQAVQLSTSAANSLETGAKFVGYSIMSDDASKKEEFINSAKKNLSNYSDTLNKLSKVYQGDQTKLKSMMSVVQNLATTRDQILNYVDNNESEIASQIYFRDYQPTLDNLVSVLQDVQANAQKSADASYAAAQGVRDRSILITVIFNLLTMAFVIFIGISLSKLMTKPIRELERAAKEMAAGHFDSVRLSYQAKDELGSLADSMRTLIHVLNEVIQDEGHILSEMGQGNFEVRSKDLKLYNGDLTKLLDYMRNINGALCATLKEIQQSADQVSGGADQVSSAAQSLSQGTVQQASSLESLTQTVEDISQKIQANAKHAKRASGDAVGCQQDMISSNEKMQQMITAMNHISESSGEIAKIVKTIQDIAFQTNILALNASVEAARAGEAGKGFAVVADEVRNLANKSQEASQSTAKLIETSQNAVQEGTDIVNDTAAALTTAVEAIDKIAISIEKISRDSNDQATAVEHVTEGIEQISSVVQTNSATSEETAAASEELSGQAEMLKKTVGRFRLNTVFAEKDEDGNFKQAAAAGIPQAAESPRQISTVEKGKAVRAHVVGTDKYE
ncbi:MULTISPECIES: methyl-accepting chemotaxis protein [Caproicibacterium]|uniref:Methyl-accepting chemotaxis protein n=1 Tax=Caproicibacterium argilliputei TaxID=3030016 RepID=A0AA97D8V1_9FIRM|nr:methyl-accepting chemotaxis protein [Caproicibacterium argilliputei]WOC31424.1 methyl-accepting chemotaxis protein [Caproicibacterium argilliputei]